jgi:hypothetical protein
MTFAVTIKARTPCPALPMEVLFGSFATFSIVD